MNNRPKRNRARLLGVYLLACVFVMTAVANGAGSLSPPGPPGPTMRTLDEIEPRQVVNSLPGSSSAVHVIDQPGHYVLSGPVTGVAGKDGIRVSADDVTIDLNGFALQGVPGSLSGVRADFVDGRFVLRSGSPASVCGWGGDGVSVDNSGALHLEGLRVCDNGGYGLSFSNGGALLRSPELSARVLACVFSGNTEDGVSFTPTTPGSYVFELRVTDSSKNGGNGLSLSSAPNGACRLSIHDAVVHGNGLCGASVVVGEGSRARIRVEGGEMSTDGLDGMYLSSPASSTTDLSLRQCSVSGNGNNGLTVTNTADAVGGGRLTVSVRDSFANGNAGDGASLSFRRDMDSTGFSSSSSEFLGNQGAGLRCTDGSCSVSAVQCVANRGGGLVVSGDLLVRGADLCDNGGDGLSWSSPPSSGRAVSVRLSSLMCRNNALSGLDFSWKQLSGPTTVVVHDSSVSGNGGDGLSFSKSSDDAVSVECVSCDSSSNGRHGFLWDSARDLSVSLCDSSARNNASNGVSVAASSLSLSRCVSEDNGGAGFQTTAAFLSKKGYDYYQCAARGNARSGFSVSGAPSSSFHECVSTGNGGDGLSLSSCGSVLADSVSLDENTGCGMCYADGLAGGGGGAGGAVFVFRSSASGNGQYGLHASSAIGVSTAHVNVMECMLSRNTLSGVSLSDTLGGRVSQCVAFGNGVAGMEVLSSSHVLAQNVCGGNGVGGTNNYAVVTPGNSVGPLVDELLIPQDSHPAANYTP